ncbi:MAG: hypothetical protein ACW99U_00360 [Candidatus Thorarchaeota archaeon]|jgi:hypothetical protein
MKEQGGSIRVRRWADRLYAFAQLAVFVVILPAAILGAVFFIFEPIVPDSLVRSLLAAATGVMVGGGVLLRVGRIRLGATLLLFGAGVGSASIGIGFGGGLGIFLSVHGFLIASSLVFRNLRKRTGIANQLWASLRRWLLVAIVITGPFAFSFSLFMAGSPLGTTVSLSMFVLLAYLVVVHLIVRNPLLGVVEIVMASASIGIIGSFVFGAGLGPATYLTYFPLWAGISMLAIAQLYRRLQEELLLRPSKEAERGQIRTVLGVQLIEEDEEREPVVVEPWVIDTDMTQVLSGVALMLVSAGLFPTIVILAQSTEWGALPEFTFLMIPLAAMFSLLVLAPSPVLLRLGKRLRRETEAKTVRVIGVAIIVLGSSVAFTWTQFYSWPFFHSSLLSLALFTAGLTGLFRDIRRFWRQAWLRFVQTARSIKDWIFTHVLVSGFIANLVLTTLTVNILSPLLLSLPASPLSIISMAIVAFSLIGLTGLVPIKRVPRKQLLLKVASLSLTLSLAAATFWFCFYVLSIQLVSSLSFGSLWFLTSILLFKIGISRTQFALIYIPGVLGISYLALPIASVTPVLFVLFDLVVLTPLLYPWYVTAGKALHNGIVRFGRAVTEGLISVGRFLRQHLLATWAVFTFLGFTTAILFFVQPLLVSYPMEVGSTLGALYLLSYIPVLFVDDSASMELKQAAIALLSVSIAVVSFFLTSLLQIVVRVLLSLTIVCGTLLLARNLFPDTSRLPSMSRTWLAALSTGVFQLFFSLEGVFGSPAAALCSAAMLGVGVSPLRRWGIPLKWTNLAYFVTTVPTGAALAFMFSESVYIALLVALTLPLPIAHREYASGARRVGQITVRSIRILTLFAAIHLVAVVGFIGVLLATFLVPLITPFLSGHPLAGLPISLTYALIALVIWFPALFVRRTENSNLFMSVVILLSAVIGTNVALLIQIPDLMQTVLAAIALSSVILTISRNLYPEKVRLCLPTLTWASVLLLVSRSLYLLCVPVQGPMIATVLAIASVGLGTLPLKMTTIPSRPIEALYILLAMPSLALLTYFVGFGILGVVFTVILVPIPIAYPYYIGGVIYILEKIVIGFRLILAYSAIFLVPLAGVLSVLASFYTILILQPFLVTLPNPIWITIASFVAIQLLYWLPFLILRHPEYPNALTLACFTLSLALSAFPLFFIGTIDLYLAVVLSTSIFGATQFVLSSFVIDSKLSQPSMGVLLSSVVLLVTYFAPAGFSMKFILTVFGFSCISSLYIGDSKRQLVSYPLATGSALLAGVWQLFLFGIDPVLLVTIFFTSWTLTLNVSERIRTANSWLAFSASSSLFMFRLFGFEPVYSVAISALVFTELMRQGPSSSGPVDRFVLELDLLRAYLISSLVFGLASYLGLVVSIEISVLLFLVVLYASNHGYMGAAALSIQSLGAVASLALLSFTLLQSGPYLDTLSSTLVSLIPFAALSIYRALQGPYSREHWIMLSFIVAFVAGLPWFLAYGTLDSMILVVPTSAMVLLMFQTWLPGIGVKKGQIRLLAIAALIGLMETVWIWHCARVFYMPFTQVFMGVGVILLSSIVLPATNTVGWLSFEPIWETVSTLFAIPSAALVSGWEIADLALPTSPILTFGITLVLFSVICTPPFLLAEKRLGIDKSERVGHYAWLPFIVGGTLLGAYWGMQVYQDVFLISGLAGLGTSLSSLVFLGLHPSRPKSVLTPISCILATSVTLLYIAIFRPTLDLLVLLRDSAFIWYIVALPVTSGPTLRLKNWILDIARLHRTTLARTAPLLTGFLSFFIVLSISTPLPLLGTMSRLPLQATSFSLLVAGTIFWLEYLIIRHLLPENIHIGILLTAAAGCHGTILSFILPVEMIALEVLVFDFVLSLSLTLALLIVLCLTMDRPGHARLSLKVLGPIAGLSVSLGMIIFQNFGLFSSVSVGMLTVILLESPFLRRYFAILLENLRNLGTLLLSVLKNLMSALKVIFARFGYVMWSLFSVLISVGVGLLTGNLFSDLLGLTAGSLLYTVPRFSVPLLTLGLLFSIVAIVRRRVKSNYGVFSGFVSVIGLSITSAVVLVDYGYPYMAIPAALGAFCIMGLMTHNYLGLGGRFRTAVWVPLPASLSLILVNFLIITVPGVANLPLVLLLSLLPALCLYLASIRVNWLPEAIRDPLWIAISITSGLTTLSIAALSGFPPLAIPYLAVFVGSVILFPVIGRRMTQLFLGPISFSLAGFAFTFVFGEILQGLLLALAAFLLFVSRFLKQEESDKPRLVYLRFAVLLALIVSIGLFALTIAILISST